MEPEEELAELKRQFALLTAKQMATECVLSTALCFIRRDPLMMEVVLQMAVDREAVAMQQDGSAAVLLPAFLVEIDEWHERLHHSENTLQPPATTPGEE